MKTNANPSSMVDRRKPATCPDQNGVVEIGLLLPANRAAELLQLARARRESVGQVLRKLIEVELAKTA